MSQSSFQLTEQAIVEAMSTEEFERALEKHHRGDPEFQQGFYINGLFADWEGIKRVMFRQYLREHLFPGDLIMYEDPPEAKTDPDYYKKRRHLSASEREKEEVIQQIRFVSRPLVYKSNGVKHTLNVELCATYTPKQTILHHLLQRFRAK